MNTPFFGCCGWAASSIVPTKRYKIYTKQLFEDFSVAGSGGSLSWNALTERVEREGVGFILDREDWPLTLKHASLVSKTIDYVKFNHEKLPKLGRKLMRRAEKGLSKRDVEYTSVAVVLMKKVVREANSAVQMDYYLPYFLDVIQLLLRSGNSILNYQGLSLLKLILEQPLFSLDNSGIIHHKRIIGFCESVKNIEDEYHLNFLLHSDKESGGSNMSLLLLNHCYLCLSHLLDMASRFKLKLKEEEKLLSFCADTVGKIVVQNDADESVAAALGNFERENFPNCPSSTQLIFDSLFGHFTEMDSSTRVLRHIMENLVKKSVFSSPESVEEIVRELSRRVGESKGETLFFNEALMEFCAELYGQDLSQASNIALFMLSGEGKDLLDSGLQVSTVAFQQWLHLQLVATQEESDKELKASTLMELESSFASSFASACSGSNEKATLKFLCAIENWCTREKVTSTKLESVLKQLEDMGCQIDYALCSLNVTKVMLKNTSSQGRIPHICPYESQVMIEEMLLALGSGQI
mmetsp:Transcript_9415/g.23433  ORF Transcript_9415/g.23433 Transcript_9415/m.23433 type:complete len:524 (-) Transcript_9415:1217-2788(-)